MNRKTSLAALVAAGIATAGSLAYANQSGAAGNDAITDSANAKITLRQALAAAEQHHTGGRAVKAELESEKGAVVYEVEVIANNNQVFDVKVDAVNGKVISSQADKPDGNKDEDAEDDD